MVQRGPLQPGGEAVSRLTRAISAPDRYQGEIINKGEAQGRFRSKAEAALDDPKLLRVQDRPGMRTILDRLREVLAIS